MDVRPNDLGKAPAARVESQQVAFINRRHDRAQQRTGIGIVNAAFVTVPVPRRSKFTYKLLEYRFLADGGFQRCPVQTARIGLGRFQVVMLYSDSQTLEIGRTKLKKLGVIVKSR